MRAWVEVDASTKAGPTPVLVDVDDYFLLASRGVSIGSHGYAQIADGGSMHLLHRWLLGLRVGDGRIGDHRNGDRADNRRGNLRVVTASGSSQNVAGRGRSPFRGVYPMPSGRWQAKVKFQGQRFYLGTFDDERAAAAAADAKRRELMPCYVPRQRVA